nr:hypothetical protein Itr_chr10CG12750 [Ipomoea trifida]
MEKIGSSARDDRNFDPLSPGHPSKTLEEESIQALIDAMLKMCAAEVQTLKDEAKRLKACLTFKEDRATRMIELLNKAIRLLQEEEVDGGGEVDGGAGVDGGGEVDGGGGVEGRGSW